MPGGNVVDDVLKPVQIGLGALQAQFRFVATGTQARDAGGLFQDTAAVFRLGGDEFGNLPLAHQGRRVGAGPCVHEQELDILGADFLAIDLVGRSGAAGDTAGDFQRAAVVEPGRG